MFLLSHWFLSFRSKTSSISSNITRRGILSSTYGGSKVTTGYSRYDVHREQFRTMHLWGIKFPRKLVPKWKLLCGTFWRRETGQLPKGRTITLFRHYFFILKKIYIYFINNNLEIMWLLEMKSSGGGGDYKGSKLSEKWNTILIRSWTDDPNPPLFWAWYCPVTHTTFPPRWSRLTHSRGEMGVANSHCRPVGLRCGSVRGRCLTLPSKAAPVDSERLGVGHRKPCTRIVAPTSEPAHPHFHIK